MISIDFSIAIAFYTIFIIAILFAFWLLEKKQKDKEQPLDARFIWFCSICSYAYIDTREELISTCPRCGSYNKKNS